MTFITFTDSELGLVNYAIGVLMAIIAFVFEEYDEQRSLYIHVVLT